MTLFLVLFSGEIVLRFTGFRVSFNECLEIEWFIINRSTVPFASANVTK